MKNPLIYTKSLEKLGLSRSLAEGVVETMNKIVQEENVTKTEFREEVKSVCEEIKSVRDEVKSVRGEIKDIKEEIRSIREEMKKYVTKDYFKVVLERYATKEDLYKAMRGQTALIITAFGVFLALNNYLMKTGRLF